MQVRMCKQASLFSTMMRRPRAVRAWTRGQCTRVASTRWGEFNDQHSIIYAPNVDVWINSLLRAAPDDPSEKGHSSILPRTRPKTPPTFTLISSETRNAPAPAFRCRTATALEADGSTRRHDGKMEGSRTAWTPPDIIDNQKRRRTRLDHQDVLWYFAAEFANKVRQMSLFCAWPRPKDKSRGFRVESHSLSRP